MEGVCEAGEPVNSFSKPGLPEDGPPPGSKERRVCGKAEAPEKQGPATSGPCCCRLSLRVQASVPDSICCIRTRR